MLGCELCCNLIRSKKGINMYAVDTAGKVAGGGEQKYSREARQPADGIAEARKDGFHLFGFEFRTLLVQCWKGRHIPVISSIPFS